MMHPSIHHPPSNHPAQAVPAPCLAVGPTTGMLFSNLAHAMDRRHSHTRLFHARVANLQAAANQHQIPQDRPQISRSVFFSPGGWQLVGDMFVDSQS